MCLREQTKQGQRRALTQNIGHLHRHSHNHGNPYFVLRHLMRTVTAHWLQSGERERSREVKRGRERSREVERERERGREREQVRNKVGWGWFGANGFLFSCTCICWRTASLCLVCASFACCSLVSAARLCSLASASSLLCLSNALSSLSPASSSIEAQQKVRRAAT